MAIEVKTHLRQLREELIQPKISQEAMARKVGVSLQWYRRRERNQQQNTSYTTATSILITLNRERQNRTLKQLHLEQLELRIV